MTKLEKTTINGAGQIRDFPCLGTASAILSVDGTFEGVIRVDGAISETAIKGGRLAFKSGTGSIGLNVLTGTGDLFQREFRIVTGGERVTLTVESWVSGSADIEFMATNDASLVFINGPIHSSEEEAVRAERAFTASTGVQALTIGNALGVVLKNPTASLVNIFLRRRLFSNDRDPTDTHLEYQAIGNPTDTLANAGGGINLSLGGAASVADFEWAVDTVANLGTLGGFLGTGEVLPNGDPYTREFDIKLPPNTGVGFIITAAGSGAGANARTGISLEWYEEIVN